MKKRLTCFCLLVLTSAAAARAEHCNRKQAFDKHTLLTMESARGSNPQMRIDLAGLGKVLASGNYDLACEEYNRVAAKYGVEFGQAEKNMKADREALSAEIKITKRCNSTESAAYFQRIQKKARDTQNNSTNEQLTEWYYAHAQEMIVNPDVFCSRLKQFVDSNGL